MNRKEYIKSQKDCADSLGEKYEDYEKSLKNIKRTKFKCSSKKDDKILRELGLTKKDLKKG